MVVELLAGDPVLLVLVVMGIGAGVGTVRTSGVSLGPAAALFVGLLIGALDERLSGATGLGVLQELGLVLFTYTVGLASGPTFVNGVRRGGLAAIGLTVAVVAALAGLYAGAAAILDLGAADRAGLFAGSTTNTPALQAAAEAVSTGNPVVAYSLAYPSAVLAMLAMVTLVLGRRLPLPTTLEPPAPAPRAERIVNWTIRVEAHELPDLGTLRATYPGLAFSRVEHDGAVVVAATDIELVAGDFVVALGPEAVVAAFAAEVGTRSDRHLPLDRATLDFRRIVVSNRHLAGRSLAELDLPHHHGVIPTRVRRGDDDLLATDALELELGDRIRVVGPSDRFAAVAELLGDSEQRLSEVDALGFALGAGAGLAVGAIVIHLGSVDLSLGTGGGPLVVGLLLGVASRTGPITWQIPHGANLVLRQLGILMFLACAGLGSGTAFADAIVTRDGLVLAGAGAVVATVFAAAVPLVLTVIGKRDAVQTAGMLAGIETQPAALAYATDRTSGDERISRAYALVFPAAMLAKVLVVQLLV